MPLMLEEMIPHEERGWRPASLGECAAEIERLRAALDKAERENEMLRDLNVSLTNAAERALGTDEQ